MNTAIIADSPLPLSSKGLKAIAQADDWDTDVQAEAAASRRRACHLPGAPPVSQPVAAAADLVGGQGGEVVLG